MDEKKRKIYIDYIKMAAIVLVVLQHANTYCVDKVVGNEGFFRTTSLICATFDVPVFIFCAGYLCRKKPIWEFYSNRIKRVLIPFLFFAGLKLVYSVFISDNFSHGSNIGEQLFNSYVIGDVYWFCYTIMLIYLVAPLMWKKKSGRGIGIFSIVVGIMCIVFSLFVPPFATETTNYFQYINAIGFFPFFLMGYAIKEYEDCIEKFIKKVGRISYLIGLVVIFIVCTSLLFVGIVDWNFMPMKLLTTITVVLLSKDLLSSARSNIVVRILSKYSLQIMFLDPFYKVVLFAIFNRLIPLSVITVTFVCGLDIVLCVLTCVVLERIPYVKFIVGLK